MNNIPVDKSTKLAGQIEGKEKRNDRDKNNTCIDHYCILQIFIEHPLYISGTVLDIGKKLNKIDHGLALLKQDLIINRKQILHT